jgi:hypothetical protein
METEYGQITIREWAGNTADHLPKDKARFLLSILTKSDKPMLNVGKEDLLELSRMIHHLFSRPEEGI